MSFPDDPEMMDKFVMVYDQSRKIGGATHPQADSGFGFTCDEDMLPLVKAVFAAGFRTLSCCQNTSESRDGGCSSWLIPRFMLMFTHDDPYILLKFCLHIRKCIGATKVGFSQTINVDNYFIPNHPAATIESTLDGHKFLIEAMEQFKETSHECGSSVKNL